MIWYLLLLAINAGWCCVCVCASCKCVSVVSVCTHDIWLNLFDATWRCKLSRLCDHLWWGWTCDLCEVCHVSCVFVASLLSRLQQKFRDTFREGNTTETRTTTSNVPRTKSRTNVQPNTHPLSLPTICLIQSHHCRNFTRLPNGYYRVNERWIRQFSVIHR